MVGQTIQGRAGEQVIGKDLAPLFEGAVGWDDHGAVFIPFGDDLIEILSGLGRNRLQSEIVQDEQIAGQDPSEVAGMSEKAPGAGQTLFGPGSVGERPVGLIGDCAAGDVSYDRGDDDLPRVSLTLLNSDDPTTSSAVRIIAETPSAPGSGWARLWASFEAP